MSVGKFTVNKILEASLNFNRKVMSWKSAIEQKKVHPDCSIIIL